RDATSQRLDVAVACDVEFLLRGIGAEEREVLALLLGGDGVRRALLLELRGARLRLLRREGGLDLAKHLPAGGHLVHHDLLATRRGRVPDVRNALRIGALEGGSRERYP